MKLPSPHRVFRRFWKYGWLLVIGPVLYSLTARHEPGKDPDNSNANAVERVETQYRGKAEPEADPSREIQRSAVETIKQQARYLASISSPETEPFFQALALVNWIQTNVNTAQYGYLILEKAELPQTRQDCVLQRAGICGNQTEVFLALAKEVGLTVRTVQVFWDSPSCGPSSHISVEVFYGGKWRFFDLSFGTYFQALAKSGEAPPVHEILSFREARNLPEPQLRKLTNQISPAYLSYLNRGDDPFEYLAMGHSVLSGKNGTIHLTAAKSDTDKSPAAGKKRRVFAPDGIADFFGHVPDYPGGPIGTTTVSLADPGTAATVTIRVRNSAGTGAVHVSWGNERVEKLLCAPGPTVLVFDLPVSCYEDDILISATPTTFGDPFYVIFESVIVE
ncbi:MAG: hypothetical protein HY040_13640 [Planctomycetes bacterium]|nr:hypothetical protein [Planctomycetota bacterium]